MGKYCRNCETNEATRVVTKYNTKLDSITEYCNKCYNIPLGANVLKDSLGKEDKGNILLLLDDFKKHVVVFNQNMTKLDSSIENLSSLVQMFIKQEKTPS